MAEHQMLGFQQQVFGQDLLLLLLVTKTLDIGRLDDESAKLLVHHALSPLGSDESIETLPIMSCSPSSSRPHVSIVQGAMSPL